MSKKQSKKPEASEPTATAVMCPHCGNMKYITKTGAVYPNGNYRCNCGVCGKPFIVAVIR